MSLGSLWQSVERHHVSSPDVTVKVWLVVPTLIVQSAAEVFVSRIESCGFSSAA